MRIVFVSDPHGSGALLRKALRVAVVHGASILIISGDLTGKQLVPLVDVGNGAFRWSFRGETRTAGVGERGRVVAELEGFGAYTLECCEAELLFLAGDEAARSKAFLDRMVARLNQWKDAILAALDLREVAVFLTPGNDDPVEINDVLRSFGRVGIRSGLSGPDEVGANEIVSFDFTNPTPWNTPRELPDQELGRRLDALMQQLARPAGAILNVHCPPANTRLDLAPELDHDLRPIVGPEGQSLIHVGSPAVREIIERYQPLLTLHGHVHDSPGTDLIGRTVCLNPGSEYSAGVLRAYVINVEAEGRLGTFFRTEA